MRPESHDPTTVRPWYGRIPPLGVTLLALISYVPLLLTRPGKVGADTKTYLYLDPGRLLSRAPYMWDPNIGLGTVTHQNIGYLWPMGPYYFVMDAIGLPDWVAQRLWMGSIIFAAGAGVRWMLRELDWRGSGVTVASFAYALSPYILEYAARISVILLPFAGLPWLIGLASRCLRRRDWRAPAVFALVTLTVGGVNATSLLLVMVGPLLWFVYATFVLREVRFSQALAAGLRICVLTLITSLWWMAGLMIQGSYGIPILRYTETYKTVADAALATELLRGLGYWFFYGQDGLGPWTASSITYVQAKASLALSFLLPGLGFLSALATRWRTRLFFALLVAAGLVIGVGSHPWEAPSPYGTVFKAWSRSDMGLSFRSTPRAAPLIILGLAVFIGSGVAALSTWRPRLHRPLAAALLVLICLNMLPLFRGQLVDRHLMRDEQVPTYWREAADALSAGDRGTRALEMPGIDFASYRWGNTVDPITPGLTDRDYVARELIPYGTPPSANMLNALDAPFQAGRPDPSVLAPMARLMGIGDVVFRADLQYERYLTPRPRETWAQLLEAGGLGEPLRFGSDSRNEASPELPIDDTRNYAIPLDAADPPAVSIFPVLDPQPMTRAISAESPTLVSGDGDGLVAMAAANKLDPGFAILYSASFAGRLEELDRQVATKGSKLVVTDTNRRAARRWGGVRENMGYTERPGEKPIVRDLTDNRLDLFPRAGDDSMTVTEHLSGPIVAASSYGNEVTYTPGDRAANAMDGDEGTAWRVAAFAKAEGQFLDVRLPKRVSADQIELLQGQGAKNRWMTEVSLRFDDGEPLRVKLGEQSRVSPGEVIRFPKRTFQHVRVTVEATDIGPQGTYKGISDIGIAELRIPGVGPVRETIRPPIDLVNRVGAKAIDHDMTYLFTRRASNQGDILAADEEPSMSRRFRNPAARSFSVEGRGRLAVNRSESQIDETLGYPSAAQGGLDATSSDHMAGQLSSRARSALDANPMTAYMTPINAPLQRLQVDYPDPRSIDSLEMTAMTTEKYSVPIRVALDADGQRVGSFDVTRRSPAGGKLGDLAQRLTFDTGPVSAKSFTVTIEAVEERHSKDWFSGAPTTLPVAINDLNLPTGPLPDASGGFDSGCRSDLLEIDGAKVSVRMVGSFSDAARGNVLKVIGCGDPVKTKTGDVDLSTLKGADSGLDLDLLALNSLAGGEAPTTVPTSGSSTGAPADAAGDAADHALPRTTVKRTGRLSYKVDITPGDGPIWLILGQSRSEGWRASMDGSNLGPSTLISGFANGWKLDPKPGSDHITVELDWYPQRYVWIGLGLSAIGVVICVALALWPRRTREGLTVDTTARSITPELVFIGLGGRPLEGQRSDGPRNTLRDSLLVLVVFAVTAFFGGLSVGAVSAVGTVVAFSSPWGRWVLRACSLALYGAAVGVVVLKEGLRSYPIDFKWVSHFELTHRWSIAATFLLVISVAVDTLRGTAVPAEESEERARPVSGSDSPPPPEEPM